MNKTKVIFLINEQKAKSLYKAFLKKHKLSNEKFINWCIVVQHSLFFNHVS